MRYRFYICKPRFPGFDVLISRSLRAYAESGTLDIGREGFSPFDLDGLIKMLRPSSCESAKSKPIFRFRQEPGLPLVSVTAEYINAQLVADVLARCLAIETCLGNDGLKLFDAEMGCSTKISKDERVRFVLARLAHQRLRIALWKKRALSPGQCCAWAKYFSLGECFHYDATIDTAIMILRGSITDAVETVDKVLRSALSGDEVLYCANGCFIVESKAVRYKIRFVVEGPGKSAQYMGWIEDGAVKLELLHRMSLYHAIQGVGKLGVGEESEARSRQYYDEKFGTRGDLRNPADRFVDSYRISRRLKKLNLDMIYGRHPGSCSREFAIYAHDDDNLGWDAWKTGSVFLMYAEKIEPLLAIFESVVPYYYEYYYEKFHFRKEEAGQILDRIKVVRLQIIKDPCDPALGKISQRLLNSDFAWESPSGERVAWDKDKEKMEIAKREMLSKNRFRILALLDFFVWWLREQRDASDRCYDGFYVMGP